jgi:hypothetical protein
MWAADDDLHDSSFIDESLAALLADPAVGLVVPEARYADERGGLFPEVPEGAAWYAFTSNDPVGRVKKVISCGYGNMIYGVYRKDLLTERASLLTELEPMNELPLLMAMAETATIRVLPRVLWTKTTTLGTYARVYQRYRFVGRRTLSDLTNAASSAGPRLDEDALLRMSSHIPLRFHLAYYHETASVCLSTIRHHLAMRTTRKLAIGLYLLRHLAWDFVKFTLLFPFADKLRLRVRSLPRKR